MSREAESERGTPPPPQAPDDGTRWPRKAGLALAALALLAIGVGAGVYHRQILDTLDVATQAETAETVERDAADETADAPAKTAEETNPGERAADDGASARGATDGSTPFRDHANEAGLTTCANMFATLGDMLTAGSRYSVQSFWNRDAPDAHAVQALAGMTYETKAYSGPAAGLVFAAPNGSACEGSMVRVAPYPGPCDGIPPILPSGSERMNGLNDIAVYSLGTGGQALLLPTDKSCVVISVASGAQTSQDQDGGHQ